MTLQEQALALAIADLGVREQGGNNRGPKVEAYLSMVHLPPGEPWCMAALFTWFELAARKGGYVNPVPRTGSALRCWRLSEPICRDSNPSVGAVYVLQHSEDSGHVGIIEAVNDDGTISEISANTNAAGSREGDCVARHVGTSPETIHGGVCLGYLCFDRAAQPPPGYGPTA